jgi:hypothetical protein
VPGTQASRPGPRRQTLGNVERSHRTIADGWTNLSGQCLRMGGVLAPSSSGMTRRCFCSSSHPRAEEKACNTLMVQREIGDTATID